MKKQVSRKEFDEFLDTYLIGRPESFGKIRSSVIRICHPPLQIFEDNTVNGSWEDKRIASISLEGDEETWEYFIKT